MRSDRGENPMKGGPAWHRALRCGAMTRSGDACQNGAMANGRCRFHGGKSTGTGAERAGRAVQERGRWRCHQPQETSMTINPQDIATRYIEPWNEADPGRRRTLLAALWTADATYCD